MKMSSKRGVLKMTKLREICIKVNREADRPSLYYFKYDPKPEPFIPKEYKVDSVEGIGEIVYRLEDHGRVQCGKKIEEQGYNLKNPVDDNGWHQHISANVAGLNVGEPYVDRYGDVCVLVQLLEKNDPLKEKIRRYLVEEQGACPLAVNFQD